MASTADNSNTTTTVQLTTEGPPTVATQEDITVTLRQPETDNSKCGQLFCSLAPSD